MTSQQIELGIEAYRNGDKLGARAIFSEIVRLNPQHEEAWLWLSACIDVKEQQIYCLNKVLSLNPKNTRAQKGLLLITELPNPTDSTLSQPIINLPQPIEMQVSPLLESTVTVIHTIDTIKNRFREIGAGKLLMAVINFKLLAETLEGNEQIENAAQGKYKVDTVVLVVTTKRILLISIAPKTFVHKIPYTAIFSVEQRSGFAMGTISIILKGVRAEVTDIVDNKKSIEIHKLIAARIDLKKEERENNSSDTATITEESNEVVCPKCGSKQISANKEGFGLGKAAAGGLLLGPVGLLGGFIGGGKVKITCIKCGYAWEAGKIK